MIKEIGSDFWIDRNRINIEKANEFIEEREIEYTSTCRGAIQLLLREINTTRRKKVAIVPGFTCHTVVEPFIRSGYTVFPYPVKKDLSIDEDVLNKIIEEVKPSVFLYHSYFGFKSDNEGTIRNLERELQVQDCILIEDKTLCMFSLDRTNAAYTVGSYRKWMALPDGAFLKGLHLHEKRCEDNDLVEKKLNAFDLKSQYMDGKLVEKNKFRKLFSVAEDILDSREELYSMSSISKAIYSTEDIDRLIQRRKENFNYLLRNLYRNDFVQYPINHAAIIDDTPYMFPLLVNEYRYELQRFLAEHDIYATIIWACPAEIKQKITCDTAFIYDSILCIPCDQRYSIDDMEKICEVYNSFFYKVLEDNT